MRHRRIVLRILLLAFGFKMILTGFASPTTSGSGEWTPAGMMAAARAGAAAVLLGDGRVLLLGGTDATNSATSTAEIYDPALDTWTPAGEMTQPRAGHTASLLADGRVLIAGGDQGGAAAGTLEIFDPATGAFTGVQADITPRAGHAAATLADGRVLLAGGVDGPNALASIDVFNPADGAVTHAVMSSPRASASATRLLTGSVLLAGGYDGHQDLSSAEIFDPATNVSTVVAATMTAPRSGHKAWLLPDNNSVLIAGGTTEGVPQATTELFVPWAGAGAGEFRPSGSLHEARAAAAGAPLAQQGRLMIAGGVAGAGSDASPLASVERYAFATLETDRDDYSPGETVTITGEGWEPGETVTMVLREAAPAQHGDRTLEAVADSSGRIFNNEFAPERHHIGVRFYLTATGTASQAQMTFTDAELLTTELVGTANDVTVEQGSTANFTIRVSATGAIQCTATAANPATATVRTVYSLSAGGVLSSSTPSGTLPFYAGAPQGGGTNCDTIWNGAPTAYSVPATVSAAATTPVGNYSIVLRASLGTTTVSTPAGSGGNLADDTPTTITVHVVAASDSTPPVVTPTVTGTLGTNGWYVSDVSVTWNVSDPQSSITSSTGCGPTTVNTDTTGTTITCSATSAGGATTQSVTIKRDATAPQATLSVTAGTAGTNGWYTSDVTVHTSGSDTISGPVTCTADQQQTTETTGATFNGSCTNDAGLVGDAAPLVVKLDKTGPSAALSVTAGTAGTNGWYTSDVTIHTAGTDTLGSPVTCTPDQQQTTETTGTQFNGSCTNEAGLKTDATPLTVKLDKTAPTGVSSSVTAGTLGANGWYTSNVTVHTTGTEDISGPADCTSDQVISTETIGQSVQANCKNQAGLTTDAAPLSIKLDKTGPSAALSVTAGTPGANGWYTSNITVHAAGTDSISSPVTCTGDQQQTTETAGATFNGSCTNEAGLKTDAAPLTVKLDKTAPTGVTLAVTSGTAGLNGWYISDVTVTTTGTETISTPLVCTIPQNQTSDTTGTAFSGSCTNNAGLVTQGTPLTVKVDKTAPVIAIASPADGASYLLNGGVNTQYTCQDATSGPASCSGPVASGAALSTGVVGPHNFTVNATDNAGNSATRTHVYHVTFSTGTCLGQLGHTVLQPINTDGTSVFKQKSTVPVKFRVCDANGVSIGTNAVAAFNLVHVTSGTTTTTVNEPVDSTTPDVTFRWDATDQQWIFNTNTKTLGANKTYGFVITLTDATVIEYQFGLK